MLALRPGPSVLLLRKEDGSVGTLVAPANKTLKRRRRLYWVAGTIAVVCAALLIARNWIAESAIELVGSAICGSSVSVGDVDLTLARFEVSDFVFFEPNSTHELFQSKRISIVPRIWQGLGDGVWLSSVAVIEPTLILRFDRDGKLLTKFPEFESSEKESNSKGPIPLRSLLVRRSKLILRQPAKLPLQVAVDRVDAQFTDEIQFRAVLSSFFGGSVELVSKLKADSLAGRTRIVVDNVRLNSCELSDIALVPSIVGRQAISGGAFMRATISHPPNDFDLRNYELNLSAQLRGVDADSVGNLCDQFDLSVVNRGGRAQIKVVANPFSGSIKGVVESDLFSSPTVAKANLSVQHIELHQLASFLSEAPQLHAIGDLRAKSELRFDHGSKALQFTFNVISKASELSIDRIPLRDATARLTSSGMLQLDDSAAPPLAGQLNGSFDWQGVSIAALADRFQAGKASGDVVAKGQFAVPLDRITDAHSFAAACAIELRNVSLRGVRVEDTKCNSELKQGKVVATIPRASLFDTEQRQAATFWGQVQTGLMPRDHLDVRFAIEGARAKTVASLLGIDNTDLAGSFSAGATAQVAFSQIADPAAWKAIARLDGRGLACQREKLSDFTASAQLQKGQIDIPESVVQWRGTKCRFAARGTVEPRTGSNSIPQTDQRQNSSLVLNGGFAASPIALGDISELASQFSSAPLPIDGRAHLDGQFSVSAMPLKFHASGKANLLESSYAGTQIGNAVLNWHADASGLTLGSSSRDFLGGSYAIDANVRDLDWTKTEIACRFNDISASRLVGLTGVAIPANGVFDGELKLTSIGSLDALNGIGKFRTRGVSINRIPAEVSDAKLAIAEGQFNATARGQISGGGFETVATSDLNQLAAYIGNPDRRAQDIPVFGEARLANVAIERIVGSLGQRDLAPLRGSVHGHCVRDAATIEAGKLIDMTGSTENISWNHSRLSDRITADISVLADRIKLDRLQGRFADGRLSGHAEVALKSQPQGTFKFSVSRVNLRRASTPFADRSMAISGNGSVAVRGRIGNSITGTANITADNVNVTGIGVRGIRFPVDWSVLPAEQIARWRCRSGVVEVGGGNVYVSTDGSYSRGLNMATGIRLDRIDTSKLIRGKSFGVGIVSGRAAMNAKRMTSMNQLTGTFDMELAQVKPLDVPVLDQLPQMIQLPEIGGPTAKDGGYLRGRLSQGTVYLDELALSQNKIQILTDGTATLDGRLKLNVTASTDHSGPIDELISLADSPLVLAGPAPVVWLAKANDAMKNRVVHVQVAGTAKRPVLRLQLAKQMTQDALKFFIKNSIGSGIPQVVADRNRRIRR